MSWTLSRNFNIEQKNSELKLIQHFRSHKSYQLRQSRFTLTPTWFTQILHTILPSNLIQDLTSCRTVACFGLRSPTRPLMVLSWRSGALSRSVTAPVKSPLLPKRILGYDLGAGRVFVIVLPTNGCVVQMSGNFSWDFKIHAPTGTVQLAELLLHFLCVRRRPTTKAANTIESFSLLKKMKAKQTHA